MAISIARRQFISALGGATFAWPLAARAQQPGKLRTVGYLGSGTAAVQSQFALAFAQRMRELGWIEGKTLAIEYRWGEGRNDRFDAYATEFVKLGVDAIVTSASAPVLAAKRRPRPFPSYSPPPPILSALAWSKVSTGRAAISPACLRSRLTPQDERSNFYANWCRACDGSPSLPMLPVRARCSR